MAVWFDKKRDRWIAKSRDARGKQVYSTHRTRGAALKADAQVLVAKSSPERMPFERLSEEWLVMHLPRVRSERTKDDYRTTVSMLNAVIGSDPIASIDGKRVEELVNAQLDRYAAVTVRKQVTRLRQILAAAVRWGYLHENPVMDRVTLPKTQKRQLVPLTAEECNRIVASAPDYYRCAFRVEMVTGLRQEELFGLTWKCVDLTAGTIRVDYALVKGKLDWLKSDAAHRTLHIGPTTVAMLTAHRECCPATALDLVFPAPWGSPMNTHTWSVDVMRPTAERAELPWVRLHDLRHVAASFLIHDGHDVLLVKEWMGHSTVTVTVDTYGHLWPGGGAHAADGFEKWLGSNVVAASKPKHSKRAD